MKPETYWPQDKLYFYATCALFPRKLLNNPLNSQQFKDYIPFYFSVDEQIKELKQLKRSGLLDLTLSRTDDSNAEYSITQIDSDEFTSILKEYLERYRNDELIGHAGFKLDTFAVNCDHLMKYINSSTREEPIVNPANIWSNWTSFNGHNFPFWEVVLTLQLVETKGKITALGYSSNSNSNSNEVRPFVQIRPYNKVLQYPLKTSELVKSIPKEWAELKIDGNTVHIWLDSGRRYKLKKFRTDSAPLNFINYVLARPDTDIKRAVIQTTVDGCAQKDDMTELVRQCGFTLKLLPLKEVFFTGTTEDKAHFVGRASLTTDQLNLIKSNLTKSD